MRRVVFALTAALIALSGCTKLEKGDSAVKQAFEEQFGEIPADQTWDYVTKASTDSRKPVDARIMVEDLGALDDFDFNDAVFDLYITTDDMVSIKVLAAGGTMPITLYFGDYKVGEVHEILGETTDRIINTGYNSIEPVSKRFYYKNSYSKNTKLLKIAVGEGRNTVFYSSSKKGWVPYMIVMPTGYGWPKERQSIKKAYPNFFRGAWYLTCDERFIINK